VISAGAHLDTAPAWNGVATSSSPFESHSQGDEDIAAPFPVSNGGSVKMRPLRRLSLLLPGRTGIKEVGSQSPDPSCQIRG
jgi:hypothetical protein